VTFSDFYNLESLVLPDSQVHPFYTPSSRPIFGDGGDVRVFGDVMAVLWRCSARLWRDLDVRPEGRALPHPWEGPSAG
jgi:hypothetical protein